MSKPTRPSPPTDPTDPDAPAPVAESPDSRRDFLKVVGMTVCGTGLAAVSLGPGLFFFGFPLAHATTTGGDDFLPVGKRRRFKTGQPLKVDFFDDKVDAWNRVLHVKVGSAWVVHREDELVAFSTLCPHLGCAIDYDPETNAFKCPCHRSAFSLDGAVVAGPAPRGMDRLELTENEQMVQIRFRRFKQGTEEKVPV